MKTVVNAVILPIILLLLITQTGIALDTKGPVAPDPQQLEEAARQGDAKVMHELGKRYENGGVCPPLAGVGGGINT